MKIKLLTPCFREGNDRRNKEYHIDYNKAKRAMHDPIRYGAMDLVMYKDEPMTRSAAIKLIAKEDKANGVRAESSTHLDMIEFAKSLKFKRVGAAIAEYGKYEFTAMFKKSEFNNKMI